MSTMVFFSYDNASWIKGGKWVLAFGIDSFLNITFDNFYGHWNSHIPRMVDLEWDDC